MAEHLYNKDGYCRAKTRGQQQLCKLGRLDKFDDHCQDMTHDFKCRLAWKRYNKKGELVSIERGAHRILP